MRDRIAFETGRRNSRTVSSNSRPSWNSRVPCQDSRSPSWTLCTSADRAAGSTVWLAVSGLVAPEMLVEIEADAVVE